MRVSLRNIFESTFIYIYIFEISSSVYIIYNINAHKTSQIDIFILSFKAIKSKVI